MAVDIKNGVQVSFEGETIKPGSQTNTVITLNIAASDIAAKRGQIPSRTPALAKKLAAPVR